MRKLRDLITALCLLAAVGVSLAAAVQAVVAERPDDLPSDTSLLIRRLAEEHVVAMPLGERRDIARRILTQFRHDDRWVGELRTLDDEQQDCVAENFVELAEMVFLEKVERYFRIQEHRRERFLGNQLEEMWAWANILEQAEQRETRRLSRTRMQTLVRNRLLRLPVRYPAQALQVNRFLTDAQAHLQQRGRRALDE